MGQPIKKGIEMKKLLLAPACLLTAMQLASGITFTMDEFTGGDSTITVDVTSVSSTTLGFTLNVTKPPSPSATDISGFWGNLSGDAAFIQGLTVNNVKFNNVLSTAFTFVNVMDSVDLNLGGVNINGIPGHPTFDIGLTFGDSSGIDTPPINNVYFELTGSAALGLDNIYNQLFAGRLQPLSANDSSKLVGHYAPPPPPPPGPDGGLTLALLGGAFAAIGLIRRKMTS
jgi:hypothetical protein